MSRKSSVVSHKSSSPYFLTTYNPSTSSGQALRLTTIILILFSACAKDKYADINKYDVYCSDTVQYAYNSSNPDLEIQPLITTNCAFGSGCHLQASGNIADTTFGDPRDFTTYNEVVNAIKLGIFQYRLLLPTSDPQHMPISVDAQNHVSGIRLDNATLCKLLTWIEQGYPEK